MTTVPLGSVGQQIARQASLSSPVTTLGGSGASVHSLGSNNMFAALGKQLANPAVGNAMTGVGMGSLVAGTIAGGVMQGKNQATLERQMDMQGEQARQGRELHQISLETHKTYLEVAKRKLAEMPTVEDVTPLPLPVEPGNSGKPPVPPGPVNTQTMMLASGGFLLTVTVGITVYCLLTRDGRTRDVGALIDELSNVCERLDRERETGGSQVAINALMRRKAEIEAMLNR